jgi:hypothetical protein
VARCMYCGKENEQLIEIPHLGAEKGGERNEE